MNTPAKQEPVAPKPPGVATSLLKSSILALVHAGLIAPVDGEQLIAELDLQNA